MVSDLFLKPAAAEPADPLRGNALGMAPEMLSWWWLVIASAFLVIPFLQKPVHIDDANFLVLSEGAARDPWRPHTIPINWDGTTRPAFDVLSNPPGIGWWLIPVRRAPMWVAHLWMALWLIPGLWGCVQIGRAFGQDGVLTALLILTSPVVVLSAQSLGPDLPLWACTTAGIGGFLRYPRHAWFFALVTGCAGLFKYSGVCLIPLLILAGLEWGGWKRMLVATLVAVPSLLLAWHDVAAYGKIHFLHMILFQNDPQARTLTGIAWNGFGCLGMLGGAVVLPVALLGIKRVWILWALAIWIAGNVVAEFDFNWATGAWNAFCIAAGIVVMLQTRLNTKYDRLAAAWSWGGFVFLLGLRFAATRYWILFQPGLWIAVMRQQKSQAALILCAAAQFIISLGLSVDDYEFAAGYQEAATLIQSKYEPSTYAGHWGWQHYMEADGWTPLERGEPITGIHVIATMADPQHDDFGCHEEVEKLEIPDLWWGPRVHSFEGRASYYCNHPSTQTFAPWTFASDPYDRIVVRKPCENR